MTYSGEIQTRRSRATGSRVTIYDAEAAYLDPSGGPYVTVCEDHGNIVNHETLSLARKFAPHPHEWCEECQAIIDERRKLRCPACGSDRIDRDCARLDYQYCRCLACATSRDARRRYNSIKRRSSLRHYTVAEARLAVERRAK